MPRSIVLSSALLVACATGAATPSHVDDTPSTAAAGAPRIAGLTLTVTPPVPGDDLVITVTGAGAFEQIQIARSLAGPGSGPCFGALSALCLDIAGPITLHATLTADASGVAVLEQTLPETVPVGTHVAFQAVIPRGTSGLNWVKSNVVTEQIVDAPLHAGLFQPGDLRITEVMVDPAAVADASGEWFEIENVSGLDANLDGIVVSDGAAVHRLSGATFLADGERLVVGASTNQTVNGGVTVDRAWSGLSLADAFGEVALLDGPVAVDVVGWDDGSSFPLQPGRSLSLAAGLDHLDNDLGNSWCSADSVYGAGDRGTPGEPNDGCEPLVLLSGDAQAELTIGEGNAGLGEWVSSAGDLDGDGFDDLLVSAPRVNSPGGDSGTTWVLYGPVVGAVDLDAVTTRLDGVDGNDHAGTSAAAVGDVDGDGQGDLLVGAPAASDGTDDVGIAYLITDPVLGPTSLSTAHARLLGEVDGDEAGAAVAGPGDLDGDGFADVLVGAPHNDTNGSFAGVVYVVHGPVVGDFDLTNADARLYGNASDQAGERVVGVGDLTGDGRPDLAITAPGHDTLAFGGGAVYLVDGAVSGDHELETVATAILRGDVEDAGQDLRVAAAGDVDGDGFADLLIGSRMSDAAYLFYGPVTGERTLSDADVVFTLDSLYSNVGSDVAGPGDLNGDGFDDLVIGATYAEPTGASGSGAAYIVYGPVVHDVDLATADVIVGPSFKHLGSVVSGAGDLDGDGLLDLAAGCTNNNGAPVWVFSGRDL